MSSSTMLDDTCLHNRFSLVTSPNLSCSLLGQVIECMRRLLLTGVLVFVKPDTAGQVAFGCIFAFLRYCPVLDTAISRQ